MPFESKKSEVSEPKFVETGESFESFIHRVMESGLEDEEIEAIFERADSERKKSVSPEEAEKETKEDRIKRLREEGLVGRILGLKYWYKWSKITQERNGERWPKLKELDIEELRRNRLKDIIGDWKKPANGSTKKMTEKETIESIVEGLDKV